VLTQPFGISDESQIVGIAFDADFNLHSFIATRHGGR
jgi:hypothetical protein